MKEKRSFKSFIVGILTLAVFLSGSWNPVGMAQGNKVDAETKRWLADWQAIVVKEDLFYRYDL